MLNLDLFIYYILELSFMKIIHQNKVVIRKKKARQLREESIRGNMVLKSQYRVF